MFNPFERPDDMGTMQKLLLQDVQVEADEPQRPTLPLHNADNE